MDIGTSSSTHILSSQDKFDKFEQTKYITKEQGRQEKHNTHLPTSANTPSGQKNKEKHQAVKKENKKEEKKKHPQNTEFTNMVTLPYIPGVTEPIQRAMKKHQIHTAVKPYTKLRQLLVYPKDKIEQDKKCNVIYEIPCRSCNKTYIGEYQKTGTQERVQKMTKRIEKEKVQQENLK